MQNSIYAAFLQSPYRSVKHSTYFEVYEELFSKYRDREIVFVEIGVLAGGSLFMWQSYFGPKARIIGIDKNPAAKKWIDYGFDIYIGDQEDKNFWMNFISEVGSVDVLLDDGGHSYRQQIITTELVLPIINDHGMLVVEDTHTSYMKNFGARRYSFIQYTKNIIDKCNLRFSAFSSVNNDTRVWSVQTFESIVVFHVNKARTNLKSELLDNHGIDDPLLYISQYRNLALDIINSIPKRLWFLKNLPGIRFLYKLILNFLSHSKARNGSLKKYFK